MTSGLPFKSYMTGKIKAFLRLLEQLTDQLLCFHFFLIWLYLKPLPEEDVRVFLSRASQPSTHYAAWTDRRLVVILLPQ